ncbi:Dynein associated protein [Rhizoctonia solani]|uniref:Dynein associated protein n=1 Tax=Rhizoctonia solani TaxID=456999 RepID=A0A8H7IGZ0_9AGAM|nr:Dynein associated protein [Rhizoctonia solani]
MQNEVPLDAVVDVTAGRGTVRFVGNTAFAPGKWVGIELAAPNGKNDGSVKDVVYFSCAPNHGVFVRPSKNNGFQGSGQSTRISKWTARVNALDAGPSIIFPFCKYTCRIPRPSIALTIRTPSNSRLPASKLPPPSPISATAARRPTLAPHKRTGSTSGAHPFAQSPLTRAQPPRTTSVQSGSTRLESDDGNGEDDEDDTITRPLEERRPSVADSEREIRHSPIESRPPISRLVVPAQSPANYLRGNETARVPSLSKQPSRGLMLEPSSMIVRSESETMAGDGEQPIASPRSPNLVVKEDAELRVKLRVLESKRTEDARLIRELETKLADAEMFVSIRPKLQAKLQALQTELSQTKRELADQQAEMSTLDEKGVEAAEQLEMAMLDKEVKKRAEAAELELESLKEKLAEIEIELQSLKEGGTPREALIKLRQITQETDAEQKRKIAELERDLSGIDELQTGYEETLSKLANADAQIEDLKIQLDDALGAEEMLVQLTDRNLQLSEKIEEMRVSIEDLEALKELNDEIEENHVEAERAMQEEIDGKDSQIRELNQKIETLEETITDYEGTIVQFRELVGHMQGDMENLRQENQIHQSESSAQATQSAAILSLNMRLQSTAAKNQAKNIEFELRKLDAAQAKEWLAIVQPYLPQVYVEVDADATACYMFFQRLATKAELIANVLVQHTDSLKVYPEAFRRAWSVFVSVLRKCDVNTFHAVGRLFPDLSPMEKRLDMHVDLLKRDEFRIMEVLAILPTAIGLTKTALENSIKDEDTVLEYGDLDIDRTLLEPIAQILEQSKSAKLAFKKLVRRVEDLIQESSALKLDLVPKLTALTTTMIKGCDFGIQLAQRIGSYLADVRAQKHNFQLASVLLHVRETAAETMSQRPGLWVHGRRLGSLSLDWSRMRQRLWNLRWNRRISLSRGTVVVRIAEVKALSAVNVDAERTVNKLNEEIKDLIRSIKTRDQTIQETSVKIELMERRMETVKKQADAIVDLEGDLAKARKQERPMKRHSNNYRATGMEKHASGMQPAWKNLSSPCEDGSLPATRDSYLKSQDLLRELNSLPPLGDKPIPVTLSRISRTSARPLTTVVRSPTPLSEVSEEEYLMEELRDEYDSEESEEAERPPSPHAWLPNPSYSTDLCLLPSEGGRFVR